MLLTVAYLTSRHDCRFEWFGRGLQREIDSMRDHPERPDVELIIVDTRMWYEDLAERWEAFAPYHPISIDVRHVPPKPSVWQGPGRLTQRDYFAASNARNTAFVLARGSHVAFADDLSVLMPGWLSGHLWAAQHRHVMCGSTFKHKHLVVDEKGILTSFTTHNAGRDSRSQINRRGAHRCSGQHLFGGTFSVPLEAALAVNGQDEIYDSIGGEDYDFGIRLERAGKQLYYSQDCGTVESEELHHVEPPMIRLDKPAAVYGPYGSNVLYHRLMRGNATWTVGNHFTLRDLRKTVLEEGKPFPPATRPDRYWLDGQPLTEM